MSLTRTSKRLVSLDVLRGITVCGMILVNNAGACGYAYAPLKHAKWDGFTPADLVFPAFMFIMGVSIYLSLNKSNFDWRVSIARICLLYTSHGIDFRVGCRPQMDFGVYCYR